MLNRDVNELSALERLRHRQGETLLSRDLRDQTLVEAQLRWWHNRAEHNAFGVALGMGVGPADDSRPGRWRVRVDAGLAYDVFGRELILPEAAELDVPPAATGQTLLARYPDGPTPVDLSWEPTDRVDLRDGVPLARTLDAITADLAALPDGVVFPAPLAARVAYDGTLKRLVFRGVMTEDAFRTLNALSTERAYQDAVLELFRTPPLGPAERPTVRPLARPKVASGGTIPGATDWVPWVPFEAGLSDPYGFQVDVDTSPAGFTSVPCYFAWLSGPAAGPKTRAFAPLIYQRIENESIKSFRFALFLPSVLWEAGRTVVVPTRPPVERFPAIARELNLAVCWLAVEPAGVAAAFPK
jgi:hypothetical protein